MFEDDETWKRLYHQNERNKLSNSNDKYKYELRYSKLYIYFIDTLVNGQILLPRDTINNIYKVKVNNRQIHYIDNNNKYHKININSSIKTESFDIPEYVTKISPGIYHTLLLTSNGNLYGYGVNTEN